jgi:hypothetical protein
MNEWKVDDTKVLGKYVTRKTTCRLGRLEYGRSLSQDTTEGNRWLRREQNGDYDEAVIQVSIIAHSILL